MSSDKADTLVAWHWVKSWSEERIVQPGRQGRRPSHRPRAVCARPLPCMETERRNDWSNKHMTSIIIHRAVK